MARAVSEGSLPSRGRAPRLLGCADGRGRSCISERAGLAPPATLLAPAPSARLRGLLWLPGSFSSLAVRVHIPSRGQSFFFFPTSASLGCRSSAPQMLHGDMRPGK